MRRSRCPTTVPTFVPPPATALAPALAPAIATAFALAFFLTASLPAPAAAAESTRALPAFIAINAKGAFTMTVEVGKAQTVVVSGDDRFVAGLKTEVVDNELQITMPDRNQQLKGSKTDPRITITLPALSRVKIEGAGETILDKINGERLDIGYRGAGHLVARGRTAYLRLSAKGVGEVDTRELRADRTDVNFEGMGAVSVYARDTLNAVVKGVGSLEYYGHPKTVNKSVAGIGSVEARD